MKIETTSHPKGNTEIHTCHEGQRIVLVHVRETGELCMGGMFRTGGFDRVWVPVLLEALGMAVEIAKGAVRHG
jgi:hypothetical protein